MQKNALLTMGIVAIAIAVGSMSLSSAQNASQAEQAAMTSQKDTTLARRLLMNSVGANNDIVHDILDGALPMDDLELRGRLQSISAMLYALPSLYRAEPNPYTEEAEKADAYHVSLASEQVWKDFENFEALSYEASSKASEAVQASPGDMLARVVELEAMCESCHEVYRKPFEYFDFDRVEDFLKE